MKIRNTNISALASAASIAAACLCCQPEAIAQETPKAGKQVAQTFQKQVTKTLSLDYMLFLPKEYSAQNEKKWPLIVFLHGLGERGHSISDLPRVKVHGPAKLVEQDPNFEFIVVSPQCKDDNWWPCDIESLNALLDHVLASVKNVDPDRVYLTGLSMGGVGSFEWAMENPERFAAVAPICGAGVYQTSWGLPQEKADQLRALPFWVFHGEADTTVSPEQSKQMVAGLKAFGVKEVKLTTYPGVGHDSWTQTYNDPKLFQWFLQHRRGENTTQKDK